MNPLAQYHAGELPEPPPALELARLAAQLAAGRRRFDPVKLTADAKALYLEAVRTVQQWPAAEAELLAGFAAPAAAGFSPLSALTRPDEPWKTWPEGIPCPKSFPATHDEFLRLIVRGSKADDRQRNWRAFLRWYRGKQGGSEEREEDEIEAVGQLVKKHGKIEWTAERWLLAAEQVLVWRRELNRTHAGKGGDGLKAKRAAAQNHR
jgi:hypothetical protein